MRSTAGLVAGFLGFFFVTWAATLLAAGPPDSDAAALDGELRDVSGVLETGLISPPGKVREQQPFQFKASDVEGAIDACVLADMAWYDAPGGAVAVILDGEPLYEKGYGEKLRDSGQTVNPGTIFRIGPVTQQMTAAAVMQQVELGRVALTDPITDLIPEFEVSGRWPADRITVWNTLTHTTGFPDVLRSGSVQNENSLSMWAQRQDDIALYYPAGSFWNYSNP